MVAQDPDAHPPAALTVVFEPLHRGTGALEAGKGEEFLDLGHHFVVARPARLSPPRHGGHLA